MGDMGNIKLQMLLDFVSVHDLFHEKCGLHEKPRNFYCFDCRMTPFCALCRPAHNHKHEHIIQVFKATRKEAVLEESIAGLIDTSDIQKLINNGASVVYIKRRRDPRAPGQIIEHHACRTCCFIFPPSTKDPGIRFCSISCKLQDMMAELGWSEGGETPDGGSTSNGSGNSSNAASDDADTGDEGGIGVPLRRRPRKQSRPLQSPMM
ncbi:PLATZ transcription factor [Musa troglodytarum]|uniref:PLATZ transcription factor n=1 Tax=Musa troglodytarum TaxID=320322 RepID=A0A9E7GMI3_9LILI|nr:PLATZ transcription factor [Musa troglodytarum]